MITTGLPLGDASQRHSRDEQKETKESWIKIRSLVTSGGDFDSTKSK